ncbi:MAG: hypothetical protein IJZ03_08740 [Clostridia bacterium]|nr:hypothetical protein [Clostridia bacterium]
MLKKKIISVVLVIVMIMGMSTMCVNAEIPGIEFDEVYYIMGAESGKLLDMPTTLAPGEPLRTTSPATTNYTKQWFVISCGTNKVSFVGATNPYGYGVSTYYLSVSLYENPQNVDFGRFTLERVTYPKTHMYKNYSGTYLIRSGDNYVASDNSGNTYLTSMLGMDCFWSFIKVYKGSASMFSFYYPDGSNNGVYNSTTCNSLFDEKFDELGYNASCHVNSFAQDAYAALNSSGIFVFRGHGSACYISFRDSEGARSGYICSKCLYNVEDAYVVSGDTVPDNAFANARCVLYLGCSTGVTETNSDTGEEYNLVDETYESGAHFVMGTTETVDTGVNNTWLRYFINSIHLQFDIDLALYVANTAASTSSYTYPIYYVGDTCQYLSIN